MTKENYKSAVCPSCKCRYRVTPAALGHRVVCKKCNTRFTIKFQENDLPTEQDAGTPPPKEHTEKISQGNAYMLLGKLAIKYKFITAAQLDQALSIQARKKAGETQYLGQILVAGNMISQAQLDFLISIQKIYETRKLDNKFGTIAVKNEFTTQDQVAWALQEQNRLYKKDKYLKLIGDILVDANMLSIDQRDAILTRQKRLKENVSGQTKPSPPVHADASSRIFTDAITRNETDFTLTISTDKLTATLEINRTLADTLDIEQIKQALHARGVNYGIIDDAEIAAYLKPAPESPPAKFLTIARGLPPKQGQNAVVNYFFETDSLKVGTVKAGGAMDFKDKGSFSNVSPESILAEKKPAVEGVPGKNIMGEEIPVSVPADIPFRSGKGTRMSEDRLRIIAATEGIAEVSAMGKVLVSPELKIRGDIGMETGHVDFDGKIHVTGSIQNGYRVRGNSLRAGEILKADIHIAGDLVVSGGIIGAKIKTDGNIQARYIHESQIDAHGNVGVEKEIIDSKIHTGGKCIVDTGTILSSLVVSQKGICAMNIGSEMSKPCHLIVGSDENVKKELNQLKATLSQKSKEMKKLTDGSDPFKALRDETEKKIGAMVQEMDKAMVDQRNLQTELEGIKSDGNPEELIVVENRLKALAHMMAEKELELELLFNEQDRISGEMAVHQRRITDVKSEMNEIRNKIIEISEWAAGQKGSPEVTVKGALFAHTIITGMESSVTIKKDRHRVFVKEKNLISNSETHQKTGKSAEVPESRFTITSL